MSLPNIFEPEVTEALLARLERLRPEAQPRWDRMDAARMVAHCSATYDELQDTPSRHRSPFTRLLNRLIIKWKVISERPFPETSPGPPSPVMADPQALAREQAKLSAHLKATQALGAQAFEGRAHPHFGRLTARRWSNLFWKHLDHHFRQFGV